MQKRGSVRSITQIGGKPVAQVSFGFEESFKKRWNSAKALQDLYQTNSKRYAQSPVFKRKFVTKQAPVEVPSCVDKNNKVQSHDDSKDLLNNEGKAQLLKLSPRNDPRDSDDAYDGKAIMKSKYNSSPNTFGTSATLSPPKNKLSESQESLPPPPSPSTLQRALSTDTGNS